MTVKEQDGKTFAKTTTKKSQKSSLAQPIKLRDHPDGKLLITSEGK